MNNILKALMIVITIGIISCSSDSILENHLLIGNYSGSWETNIPAITTFSIEYEEKNDGLVLFFSLADSSDINIISDTEFTIDRYEQNGYSNGVSGKLVEDTIYIENEVFLVSDPLNTQTTRSGTFVKQ